MSPANEMGANMGFIFGFVLGGAVAYYFRPQIDAWLAARKSAKQGESGGQ